MRRQLVAGVARAVGVGRLGLAAQALHLAHQQVDLVLLARDLPVQRVQQIVAEAGLDFQRGEAGCEGWVGVHGCIGRDSAGLAWRAGAAGQCMCRRSRARCTDERGAIAAAMVRGPLAIGAGRRVVEVFSALTADFIKGVALQP